MSQTLCQGFYVYNLISQHTQKVAIMLVFKMRSEGLVTFIFLPKVACLALNPRLLTPNALLSSLLPRSLFSLQWEVWAVKIYIFFISVHFCPIFAEIHQKWWMTVTLRGRNGIPDSIDSETARTACLPLPQCFPAEHGAWSTIRKRWEVVPFTNSPLFSLAGGQGDPLHFSFRRTSLCTD